MKFDNTFELSLPVERAWALLLDVPRITPCMPGAELVEVTGERSYKGKVAVRLGPVALTFAGRAEIEQIDGAGHKARIKAQGVDAKGRGGASAIVDFELQPSPRGSKVVVSTDLTLSGSVAQYGRGSGIIREVAAQLTREFAAALEAQLAADGAAADGSVQSARAAVAARPISGFSLFFRAMIAALRRAFGFGPRT